MPATAKFKVSYVSPSIVRCEPYEFALQYEDEQGELTFGGFEKGHTSGGMLYFPSPEEWDTFLPRRGGQRSRILERLFDYLSATELLRGIENSLLDPGFFANWSKERDYLRRNPSPDAAMRMAKAILAVKFINASSQPPLPSASFERKFRVETLKGKEDFIDGPMENVVLRADQTSTHATRVEVQFLIAKWAGLPATFDGLTVEDVTGKVEVPPDLVQPNSKMPPRQLFRLQSRDGASTLILAMRCAFSEDGGGPEHPSMFPAPP